MNRGSLAPELFPIVMECIIDAPDLSRIYAVYTCNDMDGTVHYVGTCPLAEVLNLEDAKSNSHFGVTFPDGKQWHLKIEGITRNPIEARQTQFRLIKEHSPICNQKGYNISRSYRPIYCNETGERFNSIEECVKSHRITRSQLVYHLNRKVGYRTVKGKTYQYLSIDKRTLPPDWGPHNNMLPPE